mgnify:CR=1 FL=1
MPNTREIPAQTIVFAMAMEVAVEATKTTCIFICWILGMQSRGESRMHGHDGKTKSAFS